MKTFLWDHIFLQHIEKILKQKSLEIQLWETKLAQQAMQGAEDKQKDLTEKRNVRTRYYFVVCHMSRQIFLLEVFCLKRFWTVEYCDLSDLKCLEIRI